MDKQLVVASVACISMFGSFFLFMLILSSYEIAIPNQNAVWVVFTLGVINILFNIVMFITACGLWLNKEEDYYYHKEKRIDSSENY